jgi:hypothetical protein
VRSQPGHSELIEVPDFRGMQAPNAWLFGHDRGLLLTGPDPDSSQPLLHGVVVDQAPVPGDRLHRWDVVTVWIRHGPGDSDGVREPRRPLTPMQADAVSAGPAILVLNAQNRRSRTPEIPWANGRVAAITAVPARRAAGNDPA